MEEKIIGVFLEGIKNSVVKLIQDYNFNKIIQKLCLIINIKIKATY